MNRWLTFSLAACLAWPFCSASFAQDDPPAAEPAAAEPVEPTPPEKTTGDNELAALIAKQNAAADQYNAILQAIKKQDDVAAIEKELAEIKQALAKAEAGDPDLAEARGAQRAAIKARQALIEQKISEHPEGGKALSQLKKLRAERATLQWEAALAQFQLDSPLSPVNRALAADDELAELQAKAKAAPAEERAEALAAYQKRRLERIAELEEGKQLLAEVEEASASADKLSQTMVLVEERLAPIRKDVDESTSADVAEAQAAVNSALGKGSLKELRERQATTIAKYNARVNELIAADANAGRHKAEHESLGKKIRDLKKAAAKPKQE